MTSDKNRLSLSWKVFKTTYEFLRPVLSIVAVICMFLCCLRSKEGSHARLYSALLLGGSAAILLATKIIHKCMMKKDVYRIYRSGGNTAGTTGADTALFYNPDFYDSILHGVYHCI